MFDKHVQMIGKQDMTIKEIKEVSRKIDQSRIDTTSEIRGLRDDLKSHFDVHEYSKTETSN